MKEITKYIPEAVVAVVVSAAAYIGCYLYEASYASYFGIPRELIELSVTNLLLFGTIIVLFAGLVYQLLNLLVTVTGDELLANKTSPFVLLGKKWGVAILILLILWLLSGYEFVNLWRFFWYPTIFLIADLAIPLSLKRQGGYLEALRDWLLIQKKESPVENERTPDFLKSPRFKRIINSLLVLTMGVTLCLVIGHGEARRRDTFGFLGEEAILTRYGNNLILCKYDSAAHRFLPEFRLLGVTDLKQTIVARKITNDGAGIR